MRVVKNETYPEVRDTLSRDWFLYIRRIFPNALLIPLVNEPSMVLDYVKELKLNAFILSNGNDWGEFPERDATEKRLVAFALKKNIPVLGVCRGFQALNIIFGGKLVRHIENGRKNHAGMQHTITLFKSPWQKYAKAKAIKVNSFHSQGVIASGIAKPLRIFAKSPDSVIEGIYHPTKRILGIQWHPERKNPSADFDKKLIQSFFSI